MALCKRLGLVGNFNLRLIQTMVFFSPVWLHLTMLMYLSSSVYCSLPSAILWTPINTIAATANFDNITHAVQHTQSHLRVEPQLSSLDRHGSVRDTMLVQPHPRNNIVERKRIGIDVIGVSIHILLF